MEAVEGSRSMTRADARPRIHIWPEGEFAAWSAGPTGSRIVKPTPGAALDHALDVLGRPAGAVVILEEAGR